MNLLTIAFKSLKQRSLASLLTGISVALGVALIVAIILLNSAITNVFKSTGSAYDLVIGPKGSDTQLVLSSIYYMDRPIENLPWRFYKEIAEHRHVERAIPVNLGDTTEVGNFPIVGTTPQYFIGDYALGKKFRVRGDGLQGTWDAVIGSQVARRNKWDIGNEFRMIHAGEDDHVHDEKFTVKGVLAPTGTPNDRAVFVHIDGFFALAGHDKPVNEAIAREAEFYGETQEVLRERYKKDIAEIEAHAHHDHGDHDHHHHHAISDLQKEVTSILVVMKGDDPIRRSNATMAMQNNLQKGFKAQAANVVMVMSRVLTNLVGNVRDALLLLTALIVAVSGIGIFVSIYNSMSDRKKEIAVMRALGARRSTVFSIILIESLLLCILGGIAGILLGHALVFAAAPIIEARSGLLLDPLQFQWIELAILPVLALMGFFAAQFPALTAYRTDVADALQNS